MNSLNKVTSILLFISTFISLYLSLFDGTNYLFKVNLFLFSNIVLLLCLLFIWFLLIYKNIFHKKNERFNNLFLILIPIAFIYSFTSITKLAQWKQEKQFLIYKPANSSYSYYNENHNNKMQKEFKKFQPSAYTF